MNDVWISVALDVCVRTYGMPTERFCEKCGYRRELHLTRKKPYAKPTLVFLGTIATLTTGSGGSTPDMIHGARRGPHRPEGTR